MNTDFVLQDFYHLHCFETIVDFSQYEFLKRVYPVTRRTTDLRQLRAFSIKDGDYLLDGGAERLSLQWKAKLEQLIARRDNVNIPSLDPALKDLLTKSGSAHYQPHLPPLMDEFEFGLLKHDLAPVESDGTEDTEEWNLFDEYLTADEETLLYGQHRLSRSLQLWRYSVVSQYFLPCLHICTLCSQTFFH